MGRIKNILNNLLLSNKLIEHVEGYISSYVGIIKLGIQKKIKKAVAQLLVHLVVFFFGFLFLLFLSLGLALYFNALLSNAYIGYVIVSGVYLVVFLLILSMRKKIVKKVCDHPMSVSEDKL